MSKKSGACYLCGAATHQAKVCPTAKCRLCGCVGHDAGGCPTKEPPPVDLGQFSASNSTSDSHSNSTSDSHSNNTSDSHSNSSHNKSASSFTFVELFAGMGGFRVALDKLGGRCVFASEVDRFCVRNYQHNFGGDRPAGDICRIDSELVPLHDILVGGFPCQPFSSSGSQQGMEDPKGLLFREITRILKARQPKAFLLENVRGLFLHDDGKTFQVVRQELEECGYLVKWELLNVVKLLPQERCRLYIVGVRRDLCQDDSCSYKFPTIPDLKRGVQDILHSSDGIDQLSSEDLEKMTLSTRQVAKVQSQNYTKQHPEARFLRNMTKPAKTMQSSYNKYMVGSQFVPVINSNNPQAASGQWRRYSRREAARLQGFPESFVLCHERAYHMIGNAVAPPVIAMIVAPLLRLIGVTQSPGLLPQGRWSVTRELLLEASPMDGRRDCLCQKLVDQEEECHD